MQFNKNTLIRFVYNGKNYKYSIKFSHYLYNVIPIYISEDANEIIALELEDNSILPIIPENKYKDLDSTSLEILMISTILKTYYKDIENNKIVDLLCAHWFGFSKTINVLDKHIKCSLSEKTKRIDTLENIMRNNGNIRLPDIDNVISKIKFIDII